MAAAPATAIAEATLDERARRINAANSKAREGFVEWITIVGSELKAAQEEMAGDHSGFQKWASEQFGWSKSRVYQLIAAFDVVQRLSTTVDDRTVLPSNEAQCRALASLPLKKQRRTWERAVEEASASGKEPSAAMIRKHSPRGFVAKAERTPADPDRLLRRLDATVREMAIRHPDRLADTVATLSSLIEFCRKPHVLAAMADATPKASLDICPTIRADRIPLVLDHVPAEPVASVSNDSNSLTLIGGAA